MTGTYCFAQHHIEICSLYPYVHKTCSEYQSSEDPEYRIVMTEEELHKEIEIQRSTRMDKREEGSFPDSYYELLAIYRKIAQWMIHRDTLLFHGSAIAVDGKAYLFTAKSGTGKSTHARLWREMLGERAVMINDDKPLLIIQEGQTIVCGTPWSGKHHLHTNQCVPLAGIAILNRGTENQIRPATEKELWPILLQQSYRPKDPDDMIKVLELLDRMQRSTPIWTLRCTMDPEAARVSFKAMNTGKEL